MISSISCKIEELQTRDKKREIALEAANSILDKELTRVSSFVEEKVKYFFFLNEVEKLTNFLAKISLVLIYCKKVTFYSEILILKGDLVYLIYCVTIIEVQYSVKILVSSHLFLYYFFI